MAGNAMTGKRLEFGLLGPLEMSIDGALVPTGTPKQRAVLAMLVINRNRPVGVDALITALWEEWPPPGPGPAFIPTCPTCASCSAAPGSTPGHIGRGTPGYRLSIPENSCDLGRFIAEKAAGVHAAAAGKFEQASRHLAAALRVWRGPVLDDLRDFQFVNAFATALVEDKILAHTAKAEAEIACGRAAEVITELEALTVEHPYREPLWAQLITAYYLTDRQSDALSAYRRVKTTLAEDLGIDPGPTLRGLNERILRQEPLDAKMNAKSTAVGTVTVLDQRTMVTGQQAMACLHDIATGHDHPLRTAATRIGRLSDNDIVLDSAKVSRHHAVIIDTGTNYIINDLRSSNGVHVGHQRIRGAATLNDGDHIRICDHEFTFQIAARRDR
ncbi:transcriptional regulatory protein EmbR [Mycobacterium kansasii]|uniref:Transcriptional regulatory protein EmbR n=1 Tax=Mycobacterium kansasii TaxID=1768 RepID=A0A7G1I7X9_MYCKA|nr:transcriptional regulatory protein EmbR [Mycobacterium kansasii]